jgi:hypothetical protein
MTGTETTKILKPRARSGQINGVNCCFGSNAINHRTKEARPSASITPSGIFSSGTAQSDTQPWAAVCVEMMFTARKPKVTRDPKINQATSQVSLQRIPTERQENHVYFDGTFQVQT